jgi:hypothetical protein
MTSITLQILYFTHLPGCPILSIRLRLEIFQTVLGDGCVEAERSRPLKNYYIYLSTIKQGRKRSATPTLLSSSLL